MTVEPTRSAAGAAQDVDGLRTLLQTAPEAARLQQLGLGGVLIGPGTVRRVADLVGQLRDGKGPAGLIADRRAMAAQDGEVKEVVTAQLQAAGVPVRQVRMGDDHFEVHADPETIDAACERSAGSTVLVSVGSGTVADIGKAVSARLGGVPHMIVQTAASVNGFADDQSVLLRGGVKRTTATRWPDRLVIDTDLIARAPVRLNRAGLGDLLATYTAPADWLLARLVDQDHSYSPVAVGLARAHVDVVIGEAEAIDAGDLGAIGDLSAALTLSGISMGVAGRTAPGSGMEHTVSHLLEMAHRPGEPEALHGAKVGALSVLSAVQWARVRETVRDGGLGNLRFPAEAEMRSRVLAAFVALDPSGAMGEECWSDYARKLERWHSARERLQTLSERWATFDAELDELLVPAQRLADGLRKAGAPLRLGELGIDADTARWALTNCHLMRDRFTVADLSFFLGVWEVGDVESLLSDALIGTAQ